jgi:DNA modification methylase
VRAYARADGRATIYVGDSRRLAPLRDGSVGVILTSPPYWVRGRGRASAQRYARALAVGFGREWRRVLRPDGDLWLVIGDRHDGAEWIGVDQLIAAWLRRTGWRLQARGMWAQTRSRDRWDDRVNHLLRFRKAGRAVRPRSDSLCFLLPLPRSHPDSLWDATPDPVVRALLERSARRGAVLDPFAGAGTVGRIALALGRTFVGVERDPRMARLAARRLRLLPVRRARPARRAGSARAPRARRRRVRGRRGAAARPRS